MPGILIYTFAPITQVSSIQTIVMFMLSLIWVIADKLAYTKITKESNTATKPMLVIRTYNCILGVSGTINIAVFYYIPYILKGIDGDWIVGDWMALASVTALHIIFCIWNRNKSKKEGRKTGDGSVCSDR